MSKISPLWTFRILTTSSWVCYPSTRHKSFSHGLWLGWCGGSTLVLHHWYKRLPCQCDAKSHGHLSSSPKNSSWIQHTCSRLCSLTPTPSPTLQTTKTMSFLSASLWLILKSISFTVKGCVWKHGKIWSRIFIDLKRYFHSCHNECELINRAFQGLVKRDPLSLENIV